MDWLPPSGIDLCSGFATFNGVQPPLFLLYFILLILFYFLVLYFIYIFLLFLFYF